MEFAILGPLRVGGPGGVDRIGAPKQRALLAVLLLAYRDDGVSASRLIDVLWGEEPPPTATKALQVHVSQLRRVLGAETIVTRPSGYAMARPRRSTSPASRRSSSDARDAEPAARRRAAARGARALPRPAAGRRAAATAPPTARPTGSPSCG